MHERSAKLRQIYEQHEKAAEEFKRQAACRRGCTSCCSVVGNVDVVTLEGLIIRERIGGMLPALRETVWERLDENRSRYERRLKSDCAFLDRDGSCIIYDIRPFSCRQLYSVKECAGGGPTIHRQAVALARDAVREIQRLDDNGYSGHLSYILHLLDRDEFRKVYCSGGFVPGRIVKFAKAHGIMINRFAGSPKS
jgi:Fe-S-cluster containining protein